jgi:hypothetical protein
VALDSLSAARKSLDKSDRQVIAASLLVWTEPGFPVDLCGAAELHAAFREESRTSLLSTSAALQEVREPGFPVDLCGTAELHAAFREESRTSLLSTSAALQEIREAIGSFRGPG